jgi:hypothetical protein
MNKTYNLLLNPQRIGIIIYGSLYHHEGQLKDYLQKSYINGPKLKISFLGCNPFKLNLTRVIDYKNGEYMQTYVKLFDESLGIEQIKRYIALREGNINYITFYKFNTNELINVPIHLLDYKNKIRSELKKVSKENKLDYIFFVTYPAKIEYPTKYLKKSSEDVLINTKKYLKKCNKDTLSKLESDILYYL